MVSFLVDLMWVVRVMYSGGGGERGQEEDAPAAMHRKATARQCSSNVLQGNAAARQLQGNAAAMYC